MSPANKNSASKRRTRLGAGKSAEDQAQQVIRFKEMARELGADESPHALDRAFARLDTKKKTKQKT
jgi:hypothetical protein